MGYNAHKPKKRFKKRLILLLSVFLAVIVLIIVHFAVNVNPVLTTVMREEVKNTATEIVNNALKQVMGDNIKYDDIVSIGRGKEDDIVSISVDSLLVSGIARDVTLITQSKLKALGQMNISVPVGTISGVTFLSGKGPPVNVKLLPAGSVSVAFKSDFKSTGINNTLHSIFMEVNSSVNIIVPCLSQSVSIKTDVPVATTVIIGKIPDTYLKSDKLDEMLNLVP